MIHIFILQHTKMIRKTRAAQKCNKSSHSTHHMHPGGGDEVKLKLKLGSRKLLFHCKNMQSSAKSLPKSDILSLEMLFHVVTGKLNENK